MDIYKIIDSLPCRVDLDESNLFLSVHPMLQTIVPRFLTIKLVCIDIVIVVADTFESLVLDKSLVIQIDLAWMVLPRCFIRGSINANRFQFRL